MLNHRMPRALIASLALACGLSAARADVIQWTNGANDGDWHNPANWNLGRIPNSGDDVYVWNNGSCGVLFGRGANCRSLHAYAPMSLNGVLIINNGGDINNTFWEYGSGSVLYVKGTLSLNSEFSFFGGYILPYGQQYEASIVVSSSGTFWTRQGGGGTLGVNTENRGLFRTQGALGLASSNSWAVLANTQFGRIELHPGSSFTGSNGYLGNNGLLSALPGFSGSMNGGLMFYNDAGGVLKVDAASLYIDNPSQLPGQINTLDRGSMWVLNGGQLAFPAGRWINAITGTANIVLDGPYSNISNLGRLSRIESDLQMRNGAGLTVEPIEGMLYNTGRLSMESVCGIAVSSQFYQGSGGSLFLTIGQNGSPWISASSGVSLFGNVVAYFPGQNYPRGANWPVLLLNPGGAYGVQGSANFQYAGTGTPMSLQYSASNIRIVAGCATDFNGDGFLDFFDYDDFVACFESGICPPGRTPDFNGDEFVDFFDYDAFVSEFEVGC